MNLRLVVAVVLTVVLAGAALSFLSLRSSGPPTVAEQNPCDVFPSLDGALAAWMRELRESQPALTCEHFEEVSDMTPSVELASPWKDADRILHRAPERWRSPDKLSMLLPTADGLSLVDLAGGTARRLLSAGNGESWTDAGWMDGNSFVAAGLAKGPTTGMQAPTLTVFRLDVNRVTVFRGPSGPAP